MDKCVLLIAVISVLWQTCLSTNECNRTLAGNTLTFACPSNVSNEELNIYDYTTATLDSITIIVANGINDKSAGPFTSIPINICLLKNLQTIDFSNNLIVEVDPTGILTECSSNVNTLDLSSNVISNFPSVMIYNMPNLEYLYFENNQLTDVPSNAFFNVPNLDIIDFSNNKLTTFELWALDVQTRADFSSNQISMITNEYFYKLSPDASTNYIRLSDNSVPMNLTDAIYEMYDFCSEVDNGLYAPPEDQTSPRLTLALSLIDLGTTQMACSCDQYYLLEMISATFAGMGTVTILPLLNATCTDGTSFQRFMCSTAANPQNSSVKFSQVYPRLCKIQNSEGGNLTIAPNISRPAVNESGYPSYKTRFMNPGACVFSFLNTSTMTIKCTDETSNSVSIIPADLLASSYMSSITRVTFSPPVSSLPSYLCTLPSHQIDLSFEAFTTLSDATFPCLDWFTTVSLASNQITSVNMASGNFKNLTSLDLSSNQLTMLPYSILNPTPTSLRYLDLRNNDISYIDLFLYTLKNITINLDNNPINSSDIRNPQNITLPTGLANGTSNITFPATVIKSTIIISDSFAVTYGLCNNFQALRSYLLTFRLTVATVLLDCTCASFNLREIYNKNGYNITSDFPCSIATQAASFASLTTSTCPNVTSFTSGLCASTSNQSNTTTATTANPPLQSGSGSNESNTNRTGLIVGLVVGLVGFAALVAGLIAAFLIIKSKNAAAKKHVGRAAVVGQGPESSLQSKIQPRNLRAVRLTPLSTQTSQLPIAPVSTVIPTAGSSLLSNNRNDPRTSSRGIPLRLESIRSPSNVIPQYPPNSNASNNASSFRPINNVSMVQRPIPQQPYQEPKPQKPKANQMLNSGGDTRY